MGSNYFDPPGVLFVSTVRPFAGWSPDGNYGGSCWCTGVPAFRATSTDRPKSTQTIEFQGVTGQIYVGYCVASHPKYGDLDFHLDSLGVTFY